MRGYPTFAEALEHALEAAGDDAPRTGDRFVYLPESAAPFVFVYSRAAVATRTADALLNHGGRERGPFAKTTTAAAVAEPPIERNWEPEPVEISVRPPVPAHPLTPEQRNAMEEMVALGAHIRPDFTAPELRRAFRRLARQYHPDRHPATSPEEQAHLSQIFADLTEHYRCLMTAIER
jgi:hypothetical protein